MLQCDLMQIKVDSCFDRAPPLRGGGIAILSV
jgi:hypothetical protein